MRFVFKKPKENIINLGRILGYRFVPENKGIKNEFSFIRPLGKDYPRFHIYLQEQNNVLYFNLHLDQKQQSYPGQTKHSGEYNGDLVIKEKQRIESILEKLITP